MGKRSKYRKGGQKATHFIYVSQRLDRGEGWDDAWIPTLLSLRNRTTGLAFVKVMWPNLSSFSL